MVPVEKKTLSLPYNCDITTTKLLYTKKYTIHFLKFVDLPHKASFIPVSMFSILGGRTPGVSSK